MAERAEDVARRHGRSVEDRRHVSGLLDSVRDECAALVAGAIGEGGGELVGELAEYVHVVVKTLGVFYGASDHTSAGGEDFRDAFLAGSSRAHFGAAFMGDLMDRSIAGLVWFERPSFGWVDADQIRAAVIHADEVGTLDGYPEHHVGQLLVLDRAVRRCAQFGLGIIGAYV